MKVEIKYTGGSLNSFIENEIDKLDTAVHGVAEQIHTESLIKAPQKTGRMRDASMVEKLGHGAYSVVYGRYGTGYAKIQERKQFENYTTQGTGPHFLQRAGDEASREKLVNFLKK